MATFQQYQTALNLLENLNIEAILAKAIGDDLMYGTEKEGYEDASTLGYAVMLNTQKQEIEIWKNITTEENGFLSVAVQQNPIVFLGYITPSDAIVFGSCTIEDQINLKTNI